MTGQGYVSTTCVGRCLTWENNFHANISNYLLFILMYFPGIMTSILVIHVKNIHVVQIHEILARRVKLWVAHAPGMPGTFSPPPTSKETCSKQSQHASRHVRDARAVMQVGIANPRWRVKRSRHSWHMRNPQFYVSGKRPIATPSPNGTKYHQHHGVIHL